MCVCEADIVLGSVTTQQWCARCVYFVCVCVPNSPSSSSWGVCVCTVCVCVCHRSPVQVGVFVCVLYVCVCVPQAPSSSWGVCVVYYAMCVQYRLQLSEAHKTLLQPRGPSVNFISHGLQQSPAHYQQSAQW